MSSLSVMAAKVRDQPELVDLNERMDEIARRLWSLVVVVVGVVSLTAAGLVTHILVA